MSFEFDSLSGRQADWISPQAGGENELYPPCRVSLFTDINDLNLVRSWHSCINPGQNPLLTDARMNIDAQPMVVPGQIIPKPTLLFK